MNNEFQDGDDPTPRWAMSRRDLLKRASYVVAGAALYPALAACSSSGKPGSSATTAAASGTSAGGSGAKTLSADEIATIKKYMAPIDDKFAGAGETWKIGGVFPFSTSGSVFGTTMSNGVKLAVNHIKQLGGPTIEVDYRDHAGSDPVKTRNAFIAFETAKLPVVISSYEVGGLIAASIIKEHKIFTIDPGGGNAPPGNKLPYFWGMRANWGLDGWKLSGTYMAQKLQKKKCVLMFYNVGAASDAYINAAKLALTAGGVEVVKVVKPQPGATDYSNELTAIRSAGDFDFVSLGITGNDVAYFLKQYKTSGIGKSVVTWDSLAGPTAKIAGKDAYEGVYMGGIDDFSTDSPNPWAKVFISQYRTNFGDEGFAGATPDYNSAGYYDATFLLWSLYSQIKKNGGDVNDGEQFQSALVANPTAKGVFGGDATSSGTIEFDTVSHGLKHQPMAFYVVKDGTPVKLATSDIGGVDIKYLT